MENQFIGLEGNLSKTLVLQDSVLYVSSNKVSSSEKFQKSLEKGSRSISIYPLEGITEVFFNERSETLKLQAREEDGNSKNLSLKFSEADQASAFGTYLGERLNLSKSLQKEAQLKPLLLNLLYVIIAVGATYLLGTLEDTNTLTDGSSRRSRSRGAILKAIVDTLGHTGAIILGSLVPLFLIYR
ncbi:MAG TPA: hypothetical protein DCP28_22970, partial [Cytophagales bacterium]|nr:hypothetical protein [Cytophagales bacterium]